MTKEQEMQDIDVTVSVYPGRYCAWSDEECKFLDGDWGYYCILFEHRFSEEWPVKKIKKCREVCEQKKATGIYRYRILWRRIFALR